MICWIAGRQAGVVIWMTTRGPVAPIVAGSLLVAAAVALVWAVSACCFVPVVFAALLTWLSGNGDPDEELQRLARDERQRPVVRGWGRPAGGSRADR